MSSGLELRYNNSMNDNDPYEPYESYDLSDDAEALASAGYGTDEDYEHNYIEDQYLDSGWEDRFELSE